MCVCVRERKREKVESRFVCVTLRKLLINNFNCLFSKIQPILEGAIPNPIKAEILAKDQEAANIERIMRKLVDDDGGVHMHMNGDEVGHQKRSTLLGDMRVARVPKAFLKKKTKNTMAPPQDPRVPPPSPPPPPPPLPHTSLNDVMYHVDYHRATTHTPTNN